MPRVGTEGAVPVSVDTTSGAFDQPPPRSAGALRHLTGFRAVTSGRGGVSNPEQSAEPTAAHPARPDRGERHEDGGLEGVAVDRISANAFPARFHRSALTAIPRLAALAAHSDHCQPGEGERVHRCRGRGGGRGLPPLSSPDATGIVARHLCNISPPTAQACNSPTSSPMGKGSTKVCSLPVPPSLLLSLLAD